MFSDYLISGLQKLPVVVAIALIALTLSTCGGLALCVGAAFYFLKVLLHKIVVRKIIFIFITANTNVAGTCRTICLDSSKEIGTSNKNVVQKGKTGTES